MSAVMLGLALAVVASVALNASYLLQHAGSRDAPAVSVRRPVASLRNLLGSRWWLAGAVLGCVGWAVYVGALAQAPLSLVQAFAAGGLALTVPAAARAFGHRLARAELLAVLALVASLSLLGLGAKAPAAVAAVPAGALAAAVAVTVVAAALLVALSRRAAALGAAGGMLYGLGDAAIKAVTVDAHAGLLGALTSPWAAVVVAASVAGFACFQRGLQIGPAVPVIALMTAGTNVVAIGIGLLAFGEPLGATPAAAALHLLAFALAGAAGLLLVAAQSRMAPEDGAHAGAEATARAPRRPSATAVSPPSTNASPCSTPASPSPGAPATSNAAPPTSAAIRRRDPRAASTAVRSAPAAPAHTHEMP
jgi:drug/metabolite transporter (DMT)-like permease